MSQSRKHRGRATELRLAEWLRGHGFPLARAVNSGAGGADIEETPGLSIEVKSQANLAIPAWRRQTVRNAHPGQLPVLVLRLNGQGTTDPGEFLAVVQLADLMWLMRDERDEL